jgi:hypothetical protein
MEKAEKEIEQMLGPNDDEEMTTLAVMHNDDKDSIPPSSLAGV